MSWYEKAEQMKTYKLLTLTYDTVRVPYLAARTLKQLAVDERTFSITSKAVIEDFYVNDMIIGASLLHKAKSLHNDLITVANHSGFCFSKCLIMF